MDHQETVYATNSKGYFHTARPSNHPSIVLANQRNVHLDYIRCNEIFKGESHFLDNEAEEFHKSSKSLPAKSQVFKSQITNDSTILNEDPNKRFQQLSQLAKQRRRQKTLVARSFHFGNQIYKVENPIDVQINKEDDQNYRSVYQYQQTNTLKVPKTLEEFQKFKSETLMRHQNSKYQNELRTIKNLMNQSKMQNSYHVEDSIILQNQDNQNLQNDYRINSKSQISDSQNTYQFHLKTQGSQDEPKKRKQSQTVVLYRSSNKLNQPNNINNFNINKLQSLKIGEKTQNKCQNKQVTQPKILRFVNQTSQKLKKQRPAQNIYGLNIINSKSNLIYENKVVENTTKSANQITQNKIPQFKSNQVRYYNRDGYIIRQNDESISKIENLNSSRIQTKTSNVPSIIKIESQKNQNNQVNYSSSRLDSQNIWKNSSTINITKVQNQNNLNSIRVDTQNISEAPNTPNIVRIENQSKQNNMNSLKAESSQNIKISTGPNIIRVQNQNNQNSTKIFTNNISKNPTVVSSLTIPQSNISYNLSTPKIYTTLSIDGNSNNLEALQTPKKIMNSNTTQFSSNVSISLTPNANTPKITTHKQAQNFFKNNSVNSYYTNSQNTQQQNSLYNTPRSIKYSPNFEVVMQVPLEYQGNLEEQQIFRLRKQLAKRDKQIKQYKHLLENNQKKTRTLQMEVKKLQTNSHTNAQNKYPIVTYSGNSSYQTQKMSSQLKKELGGSLPALLYFTLFMVLLSKSTLHQ